MTRQALGEILLEQGLISDELLARRLHEQQVQGVPLGRVLMAHGDITRLQLWAALARSWGIDHVDLVAQPPEPGLLAGLDPDVLLAGRWVPVHEHLDPDAARVVTVAVCDEPAPNLAERLAPVLQADRIRFVATTDWDLDQAVLNGFGDELVTDAAFELAENRPELSAADPVARWQKAAGMGVPALLGLGVLADWRATLLVVLLTLNLAFAVSVGFKLATCALGMARLHRTRSERADSPDGPDRTPGWDIPEADLPTYTVLVPAYREANVVAELVANMSRLDYPRSKLQVLLLLEADDVETIAAAKAARPPDYIRLVVVPPGGPQTKPKACNVGLAMAEGELLVIYDAEDRPEPGQLREAVAAFCAAGPDTVCFQARLNYFNTDVNVLTRMFTLEYSFWFDCMLPGLDAMGLPIPLGGTSNHFRVDALRALGGWDPFNVTEDADLGVRASALGLQVGIIDSTTWEEACSEWKAWTRQRTRWIKGYMVTALVQLRSPRQAWPRLGLRGMVGLVGLIAGTPLTFLAAPLLWSFFLYTFLGGTVPQFALPGWLKVVTLATLVVGNGAMVGLTALSARRRRATRLAPWALLNPAYWVLHSVAAWRALYQLVVRPSHWEKTPHGIVHGPTAAPVHAGSTRPAPEVAAAA